MPHVDERRYPHVAKAIADGNTPLVREYARRGGINCGIARRRKRAQLELELEAGNSIAAEFAARSPFGDWQMRMSANEHIIPPPSPYGD